MGEAAGFFALCFGSLIAILSPFATVPAFLAMTEGNGTHLRVAMARRACLVACCVIVAFSLLGLRILGVFQITVPAFQIAGGIVILRVALEMLKGSGALKVTREEAAEGTMKDDVAITPLAVPMLAGPGTITTAVLLSSQAAGTLHYAALLVNVFGIYAGTFVLLRLAAEYSFVLGEITLKVVSRLMGLLLAGIAVQFVLDGFRAWGPP